MAAGRGLTHGGGEHNDPEHVHLLAVTGDDAVLDLRGGRHVQNHGPPELGVGLVRHHVHVVQGEAPVHRLHRGQQVRLILRRRAQGSEVRRSLRNGTAQCMFLGFLLQLRSPVGTSLRPGWLESCS